MIRKIKAAWRLLFCHGYILCTIEKKKANQPFYDHNVTNDDVVYYNQFITDLYKGNQDPLRQAKEILNNG